MSEFSLSIAGIRSQITCTSKAITEALRQRFDSFVVDPEPADFEVQVEVKDAARGYNYISPAFSFAGRCIHFDLPGYQGVIDPDEKAQLHIGVVDAITGIEYFLRVLYAMLSYKYGGLMVHAAGIVRKDSAYLFFGHSGSGKTTVASNSGAGLILNDDLIVVKPENGIWQAFGTPFTNPTQTRPANASAPVVALLRLVQSPDVRLEPLGGAHAIAELVASVPVLNGSPAPPLTRCREILRSVPAYKLHLKPDPSFWPLVEAL